jgi:uncharacterized protein (DUF1330 family)
MPAYLISCTEEILDLEGFRLYVEQVASIIASFGGKYLVSSFDIERIAGEGPAPLSAAVIEFPSLERLRAFLASDDVAPLVGPIRRSMRLNLIIANVPGVE